MCSGFPNGTNGIPISFKVLPMVPMVIGNANGTIDSPSGSIGANGKPMVPLVKAWSHRRTDMHRKENGLKYAEFGYPVTKFISSAAQSSRNRYVEPGS